MAGKIKRIPPKALPKIDAKRVCGYGRVSTEKDAMLHSLSTQVSYFSRLIQNTPGWKYVGVYADEALTGTKNNRPEFQRMISDCRKGKIDLIITKSISRFARNTLTLLQTARELKELGVDIYFEEQKIHTISKEGELVLTLLAAHAQAESESVSENCKWRIRNDFKKGIPLANRLYGYRMINREFHIVSSEAETVRQIFKMYLSGFGKQKIATLLNESGIPTYYGREWNISVIDEILRNEKYTGDLHLQKTYQSDYLTKKTLKNTGQFPQYYVSENHEPIIDRSVFESARSELMRRAVNTNSRSTNSYPFTSKMTCGICGKHYRRKINNAGTKYAEPVWICTTYNKKGKKYCASKQIPEELLFEYTCKVLKMSSFDERVFIDSVAGIDVLPDNILKFKMTDGTNKEIKWKYPPRSKSWTAEKRDEAKEQSVRRRKDAENDNLHPGD